MRNIYQLGKASGVPLKTLRKLEKLGALKLDPAIDKLSELVFHMKSNMGFTLPMLLDMLDEPDLIDDLEYASALYKRRAIDQISALGNLDETSAPNEVTAHIKAAARGDSDACEVIAGWLRGILPADGAAHHWVGARLIFPLKGFLREQNLPVINLALTNVRKLPSFAPYWKSEKVGARSVIKYFRPAKLPLDL